MRRKAEYRISIKNVRTGENHKLELIPKLGGKNFTIRYQGKVSEKMPVSTRTEISNEIRKLLK